MKLAIILLILLFGAVALGLTLRLLGQVLRERTLSSIARETRKDRVSDQELNERLLQRYGRLVLFANTVLMRLEHSYHGVSTYFGGKGSAIIRSCPECEHFLRVIDEPSAHDARLSFPSICLCRVRWFFRMESRVIIELAIGDLKKDAQAMRKEKQSEFLIFCAQTWGAICTVGTIVWDGFMRILKKAWPLGALVELWRRLS